MSHQKDQDAWVQVYNVEENNIAIQSRTARETISDKFHLWILERWHEIFLVLLIALWLDPLFLYSLVINDNKKCLRVDKKLGTVAIVLRSVMDSLCIIHIISKCRTEFSLRGENGRVVVHKVGWAITKRFPIDILSVLPLPQVALLIIMPRVIDTGFLDAMKSFNIFVVLFQYVPRIIRIYPLFKKFARTYGIRIGSATLNLFLYMLACHVVGAFWYLFAIERKTMCWQEACKNRIGCVRFSCNDILEDYTFLTDACPIKTPNATTFDFGIFLGALDSGIVDSTDFLRKFFYSFWFGLQSLSSLGQNLKTSTYTWEIFFAVIISIFGLILLVFLIGNMQTYLQYKIERLEEMKLKRKEMKLKRDQWMAFHSLPRNLKKRIKDYHHYKWRETKGFDVENLLPNLPKDIRRETVRHLCLDVLKKVPLLQNMDEKLSDAICDHLKIVYYVKKNCLVGEGDPLDEMLFITQGTLRTRTKNGGKGFLEKGSFYGEELLNWAVSYPTTLENIPSSTETVQAFALTANDLKNIVSKFMSHFNSGQLEHKAAFALQEAWRCHSRKKPHAPSTITIQSTRQPAEHDIIAEQQ